MSRCCLRSDEMPPKYRLAIWQHLIARKLAVNLQAHAEAPLQARLDLLRVGSHSVAKMTSSAVSYWVEADHASTLPGSLLLLLVKRGRLHVRLNDRSFTASEGQAAAYLTDERRSIDYLDAEANIIWVTMPMADLMPQVPDLTEKINRPLRGDITAIQQLDTYMSLLMDLQEPMSPQLANLTMAHITQLAGLSLSTRHDVLPTIPRLSTTARRRQAIKDEILQQLDNPHLTGEDVARRLGITPRYLQRLLRDDGTTFTDLLRHLRLERAHALLGDPRNGSRNILSIALEVGFGDLSYFYRAFRRKFGAPPSTLRRELKVNRG